MDCSQRNFMASQAMYGLMITHQPLFMEFYKIQYYDEGDRLCRGAEILITTLVKLSYEIADNQIAYAKNTEPKAQ